MFTSLQLLLALCFLYGSHAERFNFEWADCGTSDNRKIRVDKVDVQPLPIVLTGKTHLNISVDIKLLEDMSNEVTVSIKIWRRLFRLKLPIPCLDGFLGSCKLGFCDYFNDPRANSIFCAVLKKIGKECKCPILADKYIADRVTGILPLDALPIPAAFLRLGTASIAIHLNLLLTIFPSLGKLRNRAQVRQRRPGVWLFLHEKSPPFCCLIHPNTKVLLDCPLSSQ